MQNSIRSFVGLIAAGAIATACSGSAPTAPRSGTPMVLRTGDYAAIQSASFFVRIDTVAGDSRCPVNAMCIWAGNAAVIIGVHSGVTPGIDARYMLNTGIEPRSVAALGYLITLDSLTPYPVGQPIRQEDYRAYVTVVPISDR